MKQFVMKQFVLKQFVMKQLICYETVCYGPKQYFLNDCQFLVDNNGGLIHLADR